MVDVYFEDGSKQVYTLLGEIICCKEYDQEGVLVSISESTGVFVQKYMFDATGILLKNSAEFRAKFLNPDVQVSINNMGMHVKRVEGARPLKKLNVNSLRTL